MSGVLKSLIRDVPIAVVDFETTGLAPGPDRVVEVSVFRADPGREASMILDTLINPTRPMAATEIHGITDADVKDAPVFGEIAPAFIDALAGCVIASYNVYFDIGFLRYELLRAGVQVDAPHLCLMYMRPLLQLGPRCSLGEACRQMGINLPAAHQASADAGACVELWKMYLQGFERLHIATFGDLRSTKDYKFLQSLGTDPIRSSTPTMASAKTKSRTGGLVSGLPKDNEQSQAEDRMHEYWGELTAVLSDLEVTKDEIGHIRQLQQKLKLSDEAIRSAHGRAFADLLALSIQDKAIDDEERDRIRRLHSCLSRLGWAPGQ